MLPTPLLKLKTLITQGLSTMSQSWESIEEAYQWVNKIAEILDNESGKNSESVRKEFTSVIESMCEEKEKEGELMEWIEHFVKVSSSYKDGLFHCYDIEELPRTNNDLEQTFGSFRHHQRRCTGQKKSPPSTVIRGSCRLIAAIGTKLRTFTGLELAQVKPDEWRKKRLELQKVNSSRLQQRRFRQNPDVYLELLENEFLQLILPP